MRSREFALLEGSVEAFMAIRNLGKTLGRFRFSVWDSGSIPDLSKMRYSDDPDSIGTEGKSQPYLLFPID